MDPAAPTLDEINAARRRIAPHHRRTPLAAFVGDGSGQIFLKLENLQPTGSFKVRGAASAMLQFSHDELANGVWTASAGNMAQGVARTARQLGIRCTAVVPEDAPETKIMAIRNLGAAIHSLPFAEYQQVQRQGRLDGMDGLLIHPFADTQVMAGNATIALEILDDLPDLDTLFVPYGGGGLSCGMAAAMRLVRPGVRLLACEVASAAPLSASLAAGKPVEIDFQASFVSGMGAPFVFPQMWPLASRLLDGAIVVTLHEVANAIRLLARHSHIVAEPAGAVALAAALSGQVKSKKMVCIVSGGNIDPDLFARILHEEL